MSQENLPNFNEQFKAALEEFDIIRKEETRISASGEEFVLVENVTKRLTSALPSPAYQTDSMYVDKLDRLAQTAYFQHNSNPPHLRRRDYDDYLSVFYILLDIGAPALIHQFRECNFNTDALPIDYPRLLRYIPSPSRFADFHKRFYKQQFCWCPIRFEMGMGRKYPDCISPFSFKHKITPYRDGKGPRENTASLYEIDVPEELVGPELRKSMASARVERQEKGTHGGNSKGYLH
ncbi:uncharacterized protein ColSpa_06761 [Colletotrichum spaethianum]|uniref:Uncharacterized protein n=1 Tax=Colletotrichum spaethianum TaxID=700344 RepID=A0AA37P1C9_9PEZI|nr:uncharacterized protein ColSpa_06761 [Colletotrichum spaethianum]GKT46580.1 hypothetical protein ColSpa_06761 [Colletotrichum spaethianum]